MITTISDPSTFRTNVKSKIKLRLDTKDDILIANMERAIYNYAIKECRAKKIICKWDSIPFVNIYIDRFRSALINLKNITMRNAIIEMRITAKDYIFMSHQEINPARWGALIKEKMIRDDNKFNSKQEASTDLFTCPRSTCKSKRCTYYEMQVRSADEPMTIFVTCLDCGKNFKRS